MSGQLYNKQYFISKFSTIPDKLWTCGAYEREEPNRPTTHCAYGHCGVSQIKHTTIAGTPEAEALYQLFKANGFNVIEVNDGSRYAVDSGITETTPKARILQALNLCKE